MNRLIRLFLLLFVLISFEALAQNKIDENGKKQGSWSKVDKNGKKIYQGNFKDDYEVGTFTYFYEDGKVKASSVFSDNGKKAKTTTFYPNANIMSEGEYLDKKKNGKWVLYDENGKKLSEEFYTKGIKTGVWNVFDKDGQIVETINYLNDKRNGIYYKNTYQKGYFYFTFKDDKRDGPYEDFFYFQKLKIKGSYSNNLKEGDWKYFDSIGSVVKTQSWKNDVLVSEKVSLDLGSEAKFVETKNIAYLYQTGKRLNVTLISGESISCINNVDKLLDVLSLDSFIQLNKKMMLYANISSIKGIEPATGGDYYIILEPKTPSKLTTDKESRMALEKMFKKQDF